MNYSAKNDKVVFDKLTSAWDKIEEKYKEARKPIINPRFNE